MIKKIIRKFFKYYGYEIKDLDNNINDLGSMTLYRYRDEYGNFDYSKYKDIQINANKEKINSSWVKKENIKFLSNYIKKNMNEINFGICHGTRQGLEQKWFKEYLECKILGTEISDTANNYEDTIEWDFHLVKDEWVESVDFIYSNALDHSYDPDKCLNAWISCLRKGGLCIIEHTSSHENSNATDPFGATLSKMPFLILSWGRGKFFPIEIIYAPGIRGEKEYTSFIIVKQKDN